MKNRRRKFDHGGRDWSDVDRSQGIITVIRSQKKQKMDYPLEPRGSMVLVQHDFILLKLILDFWPPKL